MTKKSITNQSVITQIVGEYFIRTCKTHDIYNVFKQRCLPSNAKGLVSPFGETYKTIHEIFEANGAKLKESSLRHHNNDRYEPITILINTLMQYYLEGGGINPSNLGMIGQEIFNLSCYHIFGDEFLDDMEKETAQGIREPQNEFEAFAIGHYITLMRDHPDEMKGVTFDDFLKKYKRPLKSRYDEFSSNIHNVSALNYNNS